MRGLKVLKGIICFILLKLKKKNKTGPLVLSKVAFLLLAKLRPTAGQFDNAGDLFVRGCMVVWVVWDFPTMHSLKLSLKKYS